MKPTITYDDFDKVELVVGKVIKASAPEWSQKLLEFLVDFGPDRGQRTIFSGIKEFYQPEEIEGHSYVFVVNLAERKMGPGVSQGMMTMADGPERPILIPVSAEVDPGTIVR